MSNPNDIPQPAAPVAVAASSSRLGYLENDQLPVLFESLKRIMGQVFDRLRDVKEMDADDITAGLRWELARLLSAAGTALELSSKLVRPTPNLTVPECQNILDFIEGFEVWRSRRQGGIAEVESDDDDDE